MIKNDEETLLRSVALQTSRAILHARLRAEHELQQAKKELEDKAGRLDHSLSVLRATMEATAEGILVTDEHGNVLRFNEPYRSCGRLTASLSRWAIIRSCLSFVPRF